jgi:hypothetical protein
MTAMEKVAEHFEGSDEEYEKRCKEIEWLRLVKQEGESILSFIVKD